MRAEEIVTKIDELRKIVAEWGDGSTLERDVAIDRVKEIYEILRFSPIEGRTTPTPAPEPTPEPIPEPIEEEQPAQEEVEEQKPAEQEQEQKKERHQQILSLYDDEIKDSEEEEVIEQEKEEEEEEEEEDEPLVEPTATDPILLQTLGFNDRLLLANELFEGNFNETEQLLLKLGAMPTLDEAIIYIAQRYRWSGTNEGAKLLYSILQNRYLQS